MAQKWLMSFPAERPLAMFLYERFKELLPSVVTASETANVPC